MLTDDTVMMTRNAVLQAYDPVKRPANMLTGKAVVSDDAVIMKLACNLFLL